MADHISLEIPADWLAGLEGEPALVVQEVMRLGVLQFKTRRAVEMYRAQVGSLGYIAEKLGISKRLLITELKVRGVEPVIDEETIREELNV